MCDQLMTLSWSSNRRYIQQCEHGTIHWIWDFVTMHLEPKVFEQVAQILEQGVEMTDPGRIRGQHCNLFYRDKGYYQLWLRNMAFRNKN
jgi:hypothetical protein